MRSASLKQVIPFLLLAVIMIAGAFIPTVSNFQDVSKYNTADMTWVLVATALVFLMTPGLSFFYAGMVNRRNVLSTMIKSFIATGIISILWIVVGFSLSFGDSIHGIIGNPFTHFFFKGVTSSGPISLAPTIPLLLFALFQLKFAIITPALVVGAVAERIKFSSYILFIVLFSLFVYAPIAHWTWHPAGILATSGVIDFAGGTVVHISAGCAALAGALVLKKRNSGETTPANIPLVVLGTGLLWFGWFGFNAGSSMAANFLAVTAFATTNTAAAAAGLAWIAFDVMRGKKPSVLGFCIGAVVGLVAITPAAGYVAIPQSAFIGFIASLISNVAAHWKSKTGIDDTLDVFPCHGLGGIVGMFLTGVFANKAVNPAIAANGLLYGGGDMTLFLSQLKGLALVISYSFIASYLIFRFINYISPLRVSSKDEVIGLDETQHGEQYLQGGILAVNASGTLEESQEPREFVD